MSTNNLNIESLGEDILVNNVSKYLTSEEILEFFILDKHLYNIFTNSFSIYKILYNKKYSNNLYDYTLDSSQNLNWKELFYLRSNKSQEIFTWGESNGGRLGYLSSRIDQSHVSKKIGGWSVHTPTNISDFNNNLIVGIEANGYSFIILLNNGELWFTGMDWKRPQFGLSTPGPINEKDYRPNPGTMALASMNQEAQNRDDNIGGRRSIRPTPPPGRFGVLPIPLMAGRYTESSSDDSDSNENGITPPPPTTTTSSDSAQSRRRLQSPPKSTTNRQQSKIQETNFLSRLYLPPGDQYANRKIVSISTGREHIIALDDKNNIYTWDTGCNSNIGIHINFENIPKSAIVSKIVGGWNLSACSIDDVGLVVWYTRANLTKEQFDRQDYKSKAKYVILPNTNNNVIDFAVGADYVLYIKKSDNKLYQFRINAQEFATRDDPVDDEELKRMTKPMDIFNDWKTSQTIANIAFTKLKSCFTNFIVFTNHDQILTGSNDHLLYSESENDSTDPPQPIIIPELQNKNIKSIEIGDYHYLALTNEGSLLSWGQESRSCGCLGIGPRELAISENPNQVIELGNNIEVKTPMNVKSPYGNRKGKWVAIAASGWHSGGIYVPDE
ncbi:uncharacterized protein KGF55_001623 [Candida pseudojiufengensis]|uniref:uncharacterized protein n=1 Tax=Candida pseudojiufengensis TaxID=497109 RepID=UPI00222475D6|nr:uncharacterized protein KGF55_001623 [Candida pseudojiufengensis]KAI5965402.1 hypothetical protein KGF55_001623 [Candida pseudojiufengensis]